VKVIGALATETMFSKDIAFSRTPAPGWASLLAAGLTDFVKSSTERNLFYFLRFGRVKADFASKNQSVPF
jgi:hypothetical protein